MAWQCRLYGHTWRHPGERLVILSTEAGEVYPFECQDCGKRGYKDVQTNSWVAQIAADDIVESAVGKRRVRRAITFDQTFGPDDCDDAE